MGTHMNRIKKILDVKGIRQTDLERLLTWSICMQRTRCNLLYLFYIILNIDVRDLLVPNHIKE